jgi:hypothetical protein
MNQQPVSATSPALKTDWKTWSPFSLNPAVHRGDAEARRIEYIEKRIIDPISAEIIL